MDWDAYLGHEAAVVAALRHMQEGGITVADALARYEAWMDARMADMIPARTESAPDPDSRRVGDSPDTEFRLGPCPECGSQVWGVKKCPHISPPWRTFLACDNEACAYHGRSRLTVDELRRQWPVGVEF